MSDLLVAATSCCSNPYPPSPPFEQWALLKAQAEAESAVADAELVATLAEAAKLALRKDHDRWLYEHAGEPDRRILRFSAQVNDDTVSKAIDILSRWHELDRADAGRPFTIYFTSPGGEIFSGISLHAYLRRLAVERPVITVASGFCASMATVIHQAGTERLIERASSYLIHDASSTARGDVNVLQDTAAWMTRINEDLHRILAERSTLTRDEISEKSRRRDWTLTAEQAVEFGFADRVI